MSPLPNDPLDDLQDRLRDIWRALHPVTADSDQARDLEIIEETDVLILTAEMFDVEREDIRVDVSPSKVVIQTPGKTTPLSRQPVGPNARAVVLPAEVRPEEAEAHYNNGILEVVLPKRIAGGVGVHRVPAAES